MIATKLSPTSGIYTMLTHLSSSLNVFVQTARLGSFAAAARALGVSPAAVGQSIRRLEDNFGVKLFTRTTRKMALTPEGTMLLDRVQTPLSQLEQIGHIFQESRGIVAGTLRIAAPVEFGRKRLVPLVARFSAQHPRVNIELDIADSQHSFIDDRIDLAFRITSELTQTTLVARPLVDLALLTFASPSYLERHGTPRHPDDLSKHVCINYRASDTKALYSWAYKIDGAIKRLTPDARFIANEADAVIGAAVEGLGLIQAPMQFVRQQVNDGTLVPVLADYSASIHTLYLCYPGRDNMPLRVRAFIDFIMTEFRKRRFTGPDAQSNT